MFKYLKKGSKEHADFMNKMVEEGRIHEEKFKKRFCKKCKKKCDDIDLIKCKIYREEFGRD